ncbi:phosphatidylinositol 3 [Xylariaceae sp. FL1019]|nr:phosphatidylinositol 3 [Xylariaceae sp. FL1019]
MSPTSHGRHAIRHSQPVMVDLAVMDHHTAPQSTLAAQLVDNISTSVRPSHPNETSELSRLFAAIEQVKNDPAILDSHKKRVEHNHMLIYVYSRVVLESLEWDVPFANKAQLTLDATRAINFLRITINETPDVLLTTIDDESFLFRGPEPLWLWAFPKVLKLLTTGPSADMTAAVESFFTQVFRSSARTNSLWPYVPHFLAYLRHCLEAIRHWLATQPALAISPQGSPNLTLPQRSYFENAGHPDVQRLQQHCTYAIAQKPMQKSRVYHHAIDVLSLLFIPLINKQSRLTSTSSTHETIPWLLDAFLRIRAMRIRWEDVYLSRLPSLFEKTIEIVDNMRRSQHMDLLLEEKAFIFLTHLCTDVLANAVHVVQDRIKVDDRLVSTAIIRIAEFCISCQPVCYLVETNISPMLEEPGLYEQLATHGSDLWTSLELLRRMSRSPAPAPSDAVVQGNQFKDKRLQQCVQDLLTGPLLGTTEEPQSNRRKPGKALLLSKITNLLWSLLGQESRDSLTGFSILLQENYSALTDLDKIRVTQLIAHLCCAADETLVIIRRYGDNELDFDCPDCRSLGNFQTSTIGIDIVAKKTAMELFSSLLQTPGFTESRKPRVSAMICLRRIAKHCNSTEFFDMESSPAAQWCLKSLQSSVRELRVAAGRTLAAFLTEADQFGTKNSVIKKNRGNVLSILRSLSDQARPEFVESCILAWSQAAVVLPDDQLVLVLVKLVEYLGHHSTFASATAFTEILQVARRRGITTKQLFEPFWSSIAFLVVKDMIEQPKLTQLLAEVLETTLPQLLLHIQSYALPWLVLTRKKDIIYKFAEVRKDAEPWQPCVDNANLGRILALLLTQESPGIEEHTMGLLRHVSHHFNDFKLVDLFRVEPLSVTLHVLKAIADAEETRKVYIRTALNQMAGMILAASGESKRKSQATGRFLHHHALGLMAQLTDVINDISADRAPFYERRRCLKAMEEMIRIGKNDVRIARPQITACTMAAMSHNDLRTAAFSCWGAMVLFFEESEVDLIIETTFYLIGHHWSSFEDASRRLAKELVNFVLEQHKPLVVKFINKLPSFSHINELSDIEAKLSKFRSPVDSSTAFRDLADRLFHEHAGVVLQALRELSSYLQRHQGYLQASAVSEQPEPIVHQLSRTLMECASRFNGAHNEITELCTQCIGLVGCLDPNRVESIREDTRMIVSSNFEDSAEATAFGFHLLENVLVVSFVTATDTKLQGFLSYAMQELLDRCSITEAVKNPTLKEAEPVYRQWCKVGQAAQEVLTPFMTSLYLLPPMVQQKIEYPNFRPGRSYGNWMRNITLDCLRRPQTPFAMLIFEPLCRLIRVKDITIAEHLFPYLILHIILAEDIVEEDRIAILREPIDVLRYEPPSDASYTEKEDRKLYCEILFRFLDYAMQWVHQRRTIPNPTAKDVEGIDKVASYLSSFPAELISQRAIYCSAYSRALFHLEQHISEVEETQDGSVNQERLLQRVQDIYSQIDEPDGLEGLSAHLRVLDIEQQVLSHRKAGRWTAAQTWYEIRLAEDPDCVDVQIDLLTCLKESGQHDVLLNYVEGIEKHTALNTINRVIPYAVEAAWSTARWETMQKFVNKYQGDPTEDFNVSIAQALLYLRKGWAKGFLEVVKTMRNRVGASLTPAATTSIAACHEPMLRAHVLTDLELIAGIGSEGDQHPQEVLKSLERRIEVLGSYVNDKQFVLGIRRAAMELLRPRFSNTDISALWLSSARLARKSNSIHQSFNAVLRASQLGDESSTIENARLLWKEGHNRKAIQTLQGAIASRAFSHQSFSENDSSERNIGAQQTLLAARAKLLLAKWLDSAGQTSATALREQYRAVPQIYSNWEKGHYYVGRHYKKVLESERTLKPDDQSDEYLTGEIAKLVIENYLRSLNYGTKYLYQTLPRILTLWLELGAQVDKAPEGKVSLSRELHHRRKIQLEGLHGSLRKYLARLPAYVFYTALPQVVARIAHRNTDVFRMLQAIIFKVVEAYPNQALWNLFAIMTSRQATSERRARGQQILVHLKERNIKTETGGYTLPSLLRKGERLAEQLLLACNNGDFQSNRTTMASITRDLHFNHKCTPCPLVVPVEACLTATLPTLTDNLKRHKAFSRDIVTIGSFLDEVLVLGSLAKPRKLVARGSNGINYGLLIKPKDDLRTDQRLMEFNSMINRSLKRDAESSRRQLYIRTYAVVPLNEECGIIEWVDGLKTLRDILLNSYRARGISPPYGHLQQMMKDSVVGDKNTKIFTEGVLGMFPPVLPNWFVAQFPNPSMWFTARLRYTRSCAVMSMVGTILGLGDRHGENVLLEEGNGGVFHVDFNCLFDKGLTFAQPERVPFRLTHNMVAAMGIFGYEGPFRKCSELTLSILRQQEETLMTILEAFIYDPTLDLQKDKKRKNEVVRLNPQSVVESIKRKVRGLLPDESIPLGVEGQVDELIKQAVNPRNLASMYIGWCPFL